jgi:hypothetical protein
MPSGHPLTQPQKKFIKTNQDKMFPSVIAEKLGLGKQSVINLISKKKKEQP